MGARRRCARGGMGRRSRLKADWRLSAGTGWLALALALAPPVRRRLVTGEAAPANESRRKRGARGKPIGRAIVPDRRRLAVIFFDYVRIGPIAPGQRPAAAAAACTTTLQRFRQALMSFCAPHDGGALVDARGDVALAATYRLLTTPNYTTATTSMGGRGSAAIHQRNCRFGRNFQPRPRPCGGACPGGAEPWKGGRPPTAVYSTVYRL
ncbi:hypothetical protein BDV95DRAFT_644602 [Massariosphaeria phaeospora]|uniref:Uncharacterized protein n=1 Tax=Massariosphaeria phaeospora TaxID=100035 RepID=A0A7C8MD49_9PLEO|nr:hypothetical protein BDV95DRAFT_644602 [Massariosphaeria phaeospora]